MSTRRPPPRRVETRQATLDGYTNGGGGAAYTRWDDAHTLAELVAARFEPPLEVRAGGASYAVLVHHFREEDDDNERHAALTTHITLTHTSAVMQRAREPKCTRTFAAPRNEAEAERLASRVRAWITEYTMMIMAM